MANYEEKFVKKFENTAQFDAGAILVFNYEAEARRNNYLPFNAFTLANQDSSSTIYIFLDNFSNVETPDFILFPSQTIAISPEEGIRFNQLILKNTHATNHISANVVKGRISFADFKENN